MSSERRLWLNVILRAKDEAAGRFLYGGNRKFTRYLAQRWLTTRSRGLMEVCEMAGMVDRDVTKLIERERKKWKRRK